MRFGAIAAIVFGVLCAYVLFSAIAAPKVASDIQNTPEAGKAAQTGAERPEKAIPSKGLTREQIEAWSMARTWAKEQLAGRKNLEFPTSTDQVKVTQKGDLFTVTGVVIEDDPFQPKPKAFTWTATVQKGRKDNWRLVRFES